jgi:hypothetical protein
MSLFCAAFSIIILFTCHSLMPRILVHKAHFEAACNTLKNVLIGTVFMDLARSTALAAAPLEVRVVVKCFAGGESIKSSTSGEWLSQGHILLRETTTYFL